MKNSIFVLRLKGMDAYLKEVINGKCFNTWSIEAAMKFKCRAEVKDQIKIDTDKYEIVEIDS